MWCFTYGTGIIEKFGAEIKEVAFDKVTLKPENLSNRIRATLSLPDDIQSIKRQIELAGKEFIVLKKEKIIMKKKSGPRHKQVINRISLGTKNCYAPPMFSKL